MIPKTNRIQRRLSSLLDNPRFWRGRVLLVAYAFSPDRVARFGVVVPKKICKKAVERNRLRRYTYTVSHPYIKHESPIIARFSFKMSPRNMTEIDTDILSFFQNLTN